MPAAEYRYGANRPAQAMVSSPARAYTRSKDVKYQRYTAFALVAALLMGLSAPFAPRAAAQSENAGTTLSATVTANATWARRITWDIDKTVNGQKSITVDPTADGGSTTVLYRVDLTKSVIEEAYISGQVCVTNGGDRPTDGLAITARLSMPPSQTTIASTPVDVSSNPVLDAGEGDCYSYQIAVTSPVPGATYKVDADVTITNHSGHMGTPFGPSPAATTVFPTAPVLTGYETVNVTDTFVGSLGSFSASGYTTYQRTFTCADAGENPNTATIVETGQNSSALVEVVGCQPPSVNQGCTPGYWKNHTNAWIGLSPSQTLSSVFGPLPTKVASKTLLQALDFSNTSPVSGAQIYRHGVAALLNINAGLNYPYTTAQVIAMVQAGGNVNADLLDAANNAGCSLN
jgi:hypothetical protein